MVTLVCALVGHKGSAFAIEVDENKMVDALKVSIKQRKERTIMCDADNLRLFLAEKDGRWLDSSSIDVQQLKNGEMNALIEELTHDTKELQGESGIKKVLKGMCEPSTDQIHLLVVVPKQAIPPNLQVVEGNRIRVDEWFVSELFSVKKKKRKLDEEESDQFTRFFMVVGIPPMTHPVLKNSRIMIRDAYVVIFQALMDKVRLLLEEMSISNIVVTGNPGIGKSCFYLYCIFQLVYGHQEKVLALSSIVLNNDAQYHKYDPSKKEFLELNEREVLLLKQKNNVVRLIEGKSSLLTGWNGVSILFASPGVERLNEYLKVNSSRHIMPVWSFEELQDYNSLFDGERKLSDNDLISRYEKFGGIPRFIFSNEQELNDLELQQAILSFKPLEIISYVKLNNAVRQTNYSHRILQMVPTSKNLGGGYYLEFLTNYIAEQTFQEVTEACMNKISEFAIAHANDDSGMTSSTFGKIYEAMCHNWFKLRKQGILQLRQLSSSLSILVLVVPEDMQIIKFSTLDEICTIPQALTYYQPLSSTFGALDAFILDGINKICYGLQITINLNHGIKAAPLNSFLLWLEAVGIPLTQFYFVFVVPCNLASQYKSQTIQTVKGQIHQRVGALKKLQQFVTGLDVFIVKA